MSLALAVTLGVAAVSAGASPAWAGPEGTTARPARVPTIPHKNRNFRIPFNIDPADRNLLKEVQLWMSDDSGFSWKAVSRTTPDRPAFTFRAPRDGEFWFAVRTLDLKGRIFPAADQKVEPSMKVVVDTLPPSLVLEPEPRRGSLASVRWEVRDEHLDLKSLTIEYQVEGARDWRVVTIHRPSLIGSEHWDAGTVEPLKVRASVSDRAGNVQEASLRLEEGTPANPALTSGDPSEFNPPPPISPISSGPSLPPAEEAPGATPGSNPRRPAVAATPPALPVGDPFSNAGTPGAQAPAPLPGNPGPVGEADPFGGSPAAPEATTPAPTAGAPAPAPAPAPAAAAGPAATTGEAGNQTILVASPRFPLQYAVDDAGPGGPASVELWVTQDGGRTWFRRGEDPDKVSPFPVDLGGEGTFGLRLVARSASGLGDQSPAPGDPPHIWVEVDSSAPDVRLAPVVVGHGQNLGKVAIQWRAGDVHLGAKPVMLYWRPADQPASPWQPITPQPVDNSGKFLWTVPTTVPQRFHVRVEVVDSAGNRNSAETAENAPVIVDRTRPRSRIIGLDPSARNGGGPSARPLR